MLGSFAAMATYPSELIAVRGPMYDEGVSEMTNTVHRAFELAKSGTCCSNDDIRSTPIEERCDDLLGHLPGETRRRQLRTVMKVAGKI